MPDLKSLQRAMQNSLLNKDSDVIDAIIDDEQADARFRLGIYQSAYHLRLTQALSDSYRYLSGFMGASAFAELVKEYAYSVPSTFASIRDYGRDLPDFIATHAMSGDNLFLAEFAKFEWLLSSCLDAQDASTISHEQLLSLPQSQWPDLQFIFHPSVSLRKFDYNFAKLWQQLNDGQSPEILAIPRTTYIFWRKQNECYFSSLTEDAAVLIEALYAGDMLADACDQLASVIHNENVPMFIIEQLSRALSEGWVTKLQDNNSLYTTPSIDYTKERT